MRLFSLDRWNLWQRLTLYRSWRGPKGERLDGTNKATERAIGWRVKERYRTIRGYKRRESVLNVSRLIAWAGNLLDGGGADMVDCRCVNYRRAKGAVRPVTAFLPSLTNL